MPMPPLNLIEPRDAVQQVCEVLGCTGEDAVQFLCDAWLNGEIMPRFISGGPPGGADPRIADWFAGAVILRDKWLPRRAIDEPGDDPEWQRIPGRSFPFMIARQQLEAALKAACVAGTLRRKADGYSPSSGSPVGRAAADFWEKAEREAMRWLQENGFPTAGDGNQAVLERHILDWLTGQNHSVSEATVRRHVRACIKRYREQVRAEAHNTAK